MPPVFHHVVHVHHPCRAVDDEFDERRLRRERLHPRLPLRLVRRAELEGAPGRRQEVELVHPVRHLAHLGDIDELDDALGGAGCQLVLLVVKVHHLAACEHEPAEVPFVGQRAAELRERPFAEDRRRVVRDHLNAGDAGGGRLVVVDLFKMQLAHFRRQGIGLAGGLEDIGDPSLRRAQRVRVPACKVALGRAFVRLPEREIVPAADHADPEPSGRGLDGRALRHLAVRPEHLLEVLASRDALVDPLEAGCAQRERPQLHIHFDLSDLPPADRVTFPLGSCLFLRGAVVGARYHAPHAVLPVDRSPHPVLGVFFARG
mmetsp:Transcript_32841/g.77837  ORF Transcript_32841/g.77837 Transcript_32841/m.77837 type:complete len:317 (-) Transcript_32841:165-1115(-)